MSPYFKHLQKDKKFNKILKEPLPALGYKPNIALRLITSIMSQQLSTKVADVIYNRFLLLFDNVEPESPAILAIPVETLRGIGLSYAKVGYVHNVAQFFIEHDLQDDELMSLSDEELIALLTQIKGIGRWTTEMILMFALGREDIFAVDDLGIQNAMVKIYKLDKTNKRSLKENMLKISNKWRPFRTHACRHLWAWKDNTPL